MKQSTKLLSLVLALVMAFSCMAVIGNAALVKSEVKWDSIDDAKLSAEQVADLALDLVDNDLLAGMEPIDLSIVGTLRLDSIDHIAADIKELTGGFVWGIGKGLLGDLGDLDFKPIAGKERKNGDVNMICSVLELVGNDNNSNILSKAAYGIGSSNGISLGLVGNFLDLGDIGDLLGDIPKLLRTLVYDLLIYGSYGFDKDAEELGNNLPTNVDTLDKMVAQAIGGLLVNPQDFTYENDVKVWDEDALVFPTLAATGMDAVKENTKITENSIFDLIDYIAPYAIYDLGINALNNNLKKALMEAVEVEFNEIDVTSLPGYKSETEVEKDSVADKFEILAEDGKESYCNYIAYDKIEKDANTWYYTTLKNETLVDDNNNPILDEEGNEQSKRVRKFYKANTATANDFYNLIDFNWKFVAPKPGEEEDDPAFDIYNINVEDENGELYTVLNYKGLISQYGSIMESLNHLLYVVFETAVKQDVKDYFSDMTGDYWVLDATTAEYEDGSSIFMDNATRLAKYLLAEHADKLFGSDSAYIDWEYDDIADKTITELVAIIGPAFFEDVMPQLIMPKNADGKYAFHSGVEILEFGALVIREFTTEIAPNVNYDSYIFAEGHVKSANDRQFKVQNAETWFNIILNMGVDIGYTYLNNITNFNTATPAQDITEARWKNMLNAAITWAANYVSDGTNSVIHGFEPAKINAYTDPLDRLSYILNTILPLGFICGCTTEDFAFDVSIVFNKLKSLLTEFDLTEIATLFGRNTEAYNILNTTNLVDMVLNLVNGIVNLVLPISENGDGVTGLLQGVGEKSLDTIISQANLKTTIQQLLRALHTQGRDLLNCALPVVGMFVKGWGTEQNFNPPQISLSRTIDLKNGATEGAQTVTVRNASDGVWRHYRDANGVEHTDEQYQVKLVSVAVNDQFGENDQSAYVTVNVTPTTIPYGSSATFTYTAANVPTTGALVRFKVGYQVIDEDGAVMSNGKVFYAESYAWLNYNGSNDGQETFWNNNGSLSYAAIYSPRYVPLSTATDFIPEIVTGKFGRDYKLFTSKQEAGITASTPTVDGITFGNVKVTFSNENGGRYFNDLKQFKTYTVQATNEDGESQSGSGNALTVSGSVNAATWEAAKKTSGSSSKWSITLRAKDTDNGPHEFALYYYDDIYYNKLTSLAASEMGALRLASTYNLTGKYYTGSVLESADSVDETTKEPILRQTNFTETAWIADEDAGKWAGSYTGKDGVTYTETVETYAETAVTITDEENSEAGYVTVDGEKISVRKVTVIDCATAINSYVPAFIAGVQSGMFSFRNDIASVDNTSVWDFKTRYENLEVTSNDVSYCRKDAVQLAREGAGDNIDATVNALKEALAASEAQYSDAKDYTDYKMYRWNRYNDARDDAAYYVNLKNDASNATVSEIDETFPYTWINEDDLRNLVAGDEYAAYILGLLEKMSPEEIAETEQWLKSKKEEYQTTSLLDVEMAASYLDRMGPRLLERDHGVITTYLADEIASADAMVKAESTYTARSWAKYKAAYDNAKAVLANPTQMTVFDAKYELMVSRNELVLVADEADYSELEALIAQAEQALKNANLYDNTNKEFGQVLAELGYHDFTNADGDVIQLFPGSALHENAEPYAKDEQYKIDRAAEALKEALARLKFKAITVKYDGKTENVTTGTLVEADEENGIEAVTARIARIAAEQKADAVKALFEATATGLVIEDTTITNDLYYAIEVADKDAEAMPFVGTNATLTFYTKSKVDASIMIPVATVKLIVDGDVNGDGAVDVIDAANTILVSQGKGGFEGCYFLAADIHTADRDITADDYGSVVNIALGKPAK